MAVKVEAFRLSGRVEIDGKRARTELKGIESDSKAAAGSLGKLASGLGRVTNALSGNSGAFGGRGGFLPGLANVSEIIQGIPQIGRLAGALVSPLTSAAEAGVRFNAFLETSEVALKRYFKGSRDESRKFIDEVRDFAGKSPFRTEGLIKTIVYGTATGSSPREALELVKDVGDAIASTGEISEEMVQGVVRALGQIKAKGTVSAEEMEQLAERGIPAWEMLSHAIGKTVAETRKLSEKGKLNGPAAVAALRAEMRARYGGTMKELEATLTGRLAAAEDTLQAGAAKATEGLTNSISIALDAGLKQAGLVDTLAGTINTAITPVAGLIKTAAVGLLGGGLTSGLKEGIEAGRSLVTQTVGDFALDAVISPFKSMLGINSPSTVYAGFGEDVAEGFENGLVDRTSRGFDRWSKALEKAGGDAFIKGVERIAKRLGVDPAFIMNMLAAESGFNPRAKNPLPGQSAAGLFQATNETARGLGYKNSEQIRQAPVSEQLDALARYLHQRGVRPGATQEQVYGAVGYGSSLNDPNKRLFRRGQSRYGMNRIWDFNGDGEIRYGELGAYARQKGGFTSTGFTVNNAPVTTANPVPVIVTSDLRGGVGVFANSVRTYQGRASGDFGGGPGEALATVRALEPLLEQSKGAMATQLSFVELPKATFSASKAMEYVAEASRVSGERMEVAAGQFAKSVMGSASKIDSVVGAIGQVAGMVPGQQVGKKRGFFSKMLGFAAPFLNFIPGVGPILSTLASIGSSALGGDYGGALMGAASGFAKGGAFRRSGSGSAAPPTVSVGAGLEPRATGGPVSKGRTYIVGEHRAEVFEPEMDGFIHSSMDAFERSRGGGQRGGGGGTALARIMQRLEAHFARLEAVSPDSVLTAGSRTAQGQAAIANGWRAGASRDPKTIEWMQRRVEA
jgi:tape measure domain-containing protein